MLEIIAIALAPVFIFLIIYQTRKMQDIDGEQLIIIIVISFLPIAREIILIILLFNNYGPMFRKPIFKKFESK